MNRFPSAIAAARRDGGFSLIVALMMLIVIILLGVGASQMAVNEERAARNDRNRQIAFQAAEAALKDAESEILSTTSPCTQPGQPPSAGRAGITGFGQTCFNADNVNGFVAGCSQPPNEGLCLGGDTTKADWLKVDFLADAKANGNQVKTVRYGRFSGNNFGSQQTLGSGQPVSIYPPRYIIEIVPKNTANDSWSGGGSGKVGPHMFRITAMGFGASENSQVVLQSIVATLK